MRVSFAISLQRTRFSAIAFQESLAPVLQELKELGYDGVELAVRNPQEIDQKELVELAAQFGLQVPAIGTGQAFIEEGLSLSSLNPEIRHRAKERVKDHILLASIFQSLVIIGLIRGVLPEDRKAKDEALSYFRESLKECALFARERGIRMVIEPLNRYETNFLNTVEETVAFIDSLGCENVGILADTFHMNIEEPNIPQAIAQAGELLWHFHIADSNRWAPGFGHLDFRPIFEALETQGYRGFVSAEIIQKPSFQEAARKTMATLQGFPPFSKRSQNPRDTYPKIG
jgi:sugar phosphate isomerase/epimerase